MKVINTGILILMLLVTAIRTNADIIIRTTDVTYTPGTEFTIPIIIDGASEEGTPISSANIVFTFDTAAVQFMQFQNFNPLTPQNQWFFSGNNNTGIVAANWIEPNLLTVALPDGSVLYNVKFKAKPGACAFTFITYEFTDWVYNEIPATPDHGSYASIQQVSFQVDMRDQSVSPDGVHLAGTFNSWSTSATLMTAGDSTIYSVTIPLISDSLYYFRYVNGNTNAGYEIVPSECGILSGNDYNRSLLNPGGDTILAAICFSSCDPCPPQVQVTFRVDMSEQNISADGVHIAGSFNNWNPSATLMNNLGNDIFGVTQPIVPGTGVEYRFVNGNTSAGYEIVPENCGVPAGGGLYNRFLAVPESDTTLSAVCFSNCSECLTLRSVTFKVDMGEENISPNGVHLAGSFNGFNPGSVEMTNQGNDVFIATLDLFEDELITYRFVNGDDASGFETVPETCGLDNGSGIFNRYLTVPQQDTILTEVCFSSCEDCEQQPWEKDITFQVDMSKEDISENGIYLAGTFNGWDPAAINMLHVGNNIYSITLTLNENDAHQYRFVNGNTTEGYENVPEECGVSGTSGGLERQITIPMQDTILPAVCFAACDPCVIYQVTIQVDMMRETISVFGIHFASSVNNWDPGSDEMLSTGSTVYETTIPVYQGDTLTYRFVNGNQSSEMEPVPSECGWIYNGTDYARIIMPVSDTILGPICFSWCDPCDVGVIENGGLAEIGLPFPNPARDYIHIPLSVYEPVKVSVRMFEMTGIEKRQKTVSLTPGDHMIGFPLNDMPEGIYLLKIQAEGKSGALIFSEIISVNQ